MVLAERPAVQPDRDRRVEPVADEADSLCGAWLGADLVERAPVPPLALGDPRDGRLVRVRVRLWDQAVADEGRVDVGRERELEPGAVVEVAVERAGPNPVPGIEVGQTATAENHHSFTAPADAFMIRRWKTKKRTATGIVISVDAASFKG